jgi:hypothetical protein
MTSLSSRIAAAKAKMRAGEYATPAEPIKGAWYAALYFNDEVPYSLRWDGDHYRDGSGKIFPIPQYVLLLPPRPAPRKGYDGDN